MAPETDQMTPPTAVPPPPPMGAMNKGVTGADPTNTAAPTAPAASPSDPENQLMAEATRLGGPLGGIAMGAATGAAHHAESQNQPSINRQDPAQVRQDPEFLKLDPQSKYDILSSIDPKFTALGETDRRAVVSQLIPNQTSDQENVGNILGEQWLSPEAQNEANQKEKGISAAETAGLLTGPLGAAAQTVLPGLGGSIITGAAGRGINEVTHQVGAGENPFRAQMLGQTGIATLEGAGEGMGAHLATQGIGAVGGAAINKIKSMVTPTATEEAADLSEQLGDSPWQHFKSIPKGELPRMAGGEEPFISDQPLDRATISKMPQGKNLDTETADLLTKYAGDTIEKGSYPMNTAMRAVGPVNENLNRLGLEMNKLVREAPAFSQSVIEDPEVGTSLLDDMQTMKEHLPGGASSAQSKIIQNEMDVANRALSYERPARTFNGASRTRR